MLRTLIVAFVVGVAVLPGCAAEQSGTTTTTSGVMKKMSPACAELDSSCMSDVDCCGTWCVGGLCRLRAP